MGRAPGVSNCQTHLTTDVVESFSGVFFIRCNGSFSKTKVFSGNFPCVFFYSIYYLRHQSIEWGAYCEYFWKKLNYVITGVDCTGIMLGLDSANDRRLYIVTPPIIGGVHTPPDPYCIISISINTAQYKSLWSIGAMQKALNVSSSYDQSPQQWKNIDWNEIYYVNNKSILSMNMKNLKAFHFFSW